VAESKIRQCSKLMAELGLTIAFAESATAGWLCSEFALTGESGSVLKGGIACYDADLKVSLLGVAQELIDHCTPESMEVTRAMTYCLAKLIPSDIKVTVTGLTTPGGSETEEKPVGTMFVFALIKGREAGFRKVFKGSCEDVIQQTIKATANLLINELKQINNNKHKSTIMATKTTKKAAPTANRTPEAESALKELFLDELKDIYWAEQHLAKALPKMAKNATSEDLKQAINNHLEETKNHITRVEQAFESIGEKAKTVKCLAMEGLLKEADELLSEVEKGTEVRDAAIISAAQKVEHYEIASYGTLKTLAVTLGYNDAQALFEETLAEEKNADALLTQVAENYVNEAAAAETA